MRFLLLSIAAFLLLQTISADDNGVAPTGAVPSKCENLLPKETCDGLNKLVEFLKEKKSTVQDAINEALQKHITNTKELVKFIKEYIAKSFTCSTTLPQVACDKLAEYAKNAKLAALNVKLAIEEAILNGATTVNGIVNSVVTTLKNEINCENFLGPQSCDSLQKALQKLAQQPGLLKEAIWRVAQRHITKTTEFLTAVKETLTQLITNFTCEAVLPQASCDKLRSIAKSLHLTTQQLRASIEDAIFTGVSTATAIFDQTLAYLKERINCDAILGTPACIALTKVVGELHENVQLIKDAIFQAVTHNVNRAVDILKYVKNYLVEKAVNFKCTDVLAQSQCDFIQKVATRFQIRAEDLKTVLLEAVVNGTFTAKQIYDVTLGALIEEARDISCEDLAGDFVCGPLKALATNLGIKVSQISLAVKEAIVNGKQTATAILAFAKEFLMEKVSCDNFLGEAACNRIESLAARLHIKFQDVINKLKELYTNGVTKVTDLVKDIISWIWNKFFGNAQKRDLDGSRVKKAFESIYKKIAEIINNLKGTDMSQAKEKVKEILEKVKIFTKEKIELIKAMVSKALKEKASVDKQLDATYDLINDVAETEVRDIIGY